MKFENKWVKNLYNKVTLWPRSLFEDLFIILLLNAIHSNPNPYQYQFTHINKDQAPSGSVLAGICLTLQAPHHPDNSPSSSHTHTLTVQPLTLASIRLTVFVRVSTVIKKCPWCNFMPVDTHRPYAKDYGACRVSVSLGRVAGARAMVTLWQSLNGPRRQC